MQIFHFIIIITITIDTGVVHTIMVPTTTRGTIQQSCLDTPSLPWINQTRDIQTLFHLIFHHVRSGTLIHVTLFGVVIIWIIVVRWRSQMNTSNQFVVLRQGGQLNRINRVFSTRNKCYKLHIIYIYIYGVYCCM